MTARWIVVASQKGIKIFKEDENGNSLRVIKLIENPLNVARRKELIRKEAGLGVRSLGNGGVARYSETKRHDPKEEAAIQFAREVIDYIEIEKQKKSFEVLTIAAEPHFLGKIKAALANRPSLRDLEIEWIKKDLQNTPRGELSQFLLLRNQPPAEVIALENATVT